MMSTLHLLWIVPLCGFVGFVWAAILMIGKSGEGGK